MSTYLVCAVTDELMDPTLAQEAKHILTVPSISRKAINKSDKQSLVAGSCSQPSGK